MELGWLEDFIELAAVRNFSVAAAARHVTQPAFSRRVKALENWIGAELIDRSSYPVTLTKSGETLLEAARDLTREIYRLRDECRQEKRAGIETLSISALHSIALSIFPDLLMQIERDAGAFTTHLEATDFYDCIEALALGRCDFALCYTHPLGPPVLQTGQFTSKMIGTDPFLLMSACEPDGKPLFSLHQNPPGKPVPLVAYSSGCFLGKIQSALTRRLQDQGIEFKHVYENSMSEALKRMILVGKGIGWLPLSAAKREVEDGRLKIIEDLDQHIELAINVFRKAGASSAVCERFWKHI